MSEVDQATRVAIALQLPDWVRVKYVEVHEFGMLFLTLHGPFFTNPRLPAELHVDGHSYTYEGLYGHAYSGGNHRRLYQRL